jgi:hypothetical protein
LFCGGERNGWTPQFRTSHGARKSEGWRNFYRTFFPASLGRESAETAGKDAEQRIGAATGGGIEDDFDTSEREITTGWAAIGLVGRLLA